MRTDCKVERVGEIHITREGYPIKIIGYFSKRNCTVQFENGVVVYDVFYHNIKRGCISNPFHPSVYGRGYLGVCKLPTTDIKAYKVWMRMFTRAYSEDYHKTQPTYESVEVCKEWWNFQNFVKWHDKKCRKDFQLDKDILIKGNKLYSSETCCFVPRIINAQFMREDRRKNGENPGVRETDNKKYIAVLINKNGIRTTKTFDTKKEALITFKANKEERIKWLADEWKSLIAPEVYNAMYAYEVEITD